MPTTIDLAPTPPDTARPLTFADDASAFAAWMAAMPPQFNSVIATLMAGSSAAGLALNLADTATGLGSALVGNKRSVAGALARTVFDELNAQVLNAVVNFGADPTGVSNSTTALKAFWDACISSGLRGWIPAGTYLVTPGVLAFDTPFVDADAPIIETPGAAAVTFKAASSVNAPFISYTNGTATSGAGKYWYGGRLGGITYDQNGKATSSGQHAISLTGVWGMSFDPYIANDIGGSALSIPAKLFGGTNPDPYAVTACYFWGISANRVQGRVVDNQNYVGLNGCNFFLIRGIETVLGGVFGNGAGNNFFSVSLGECQGWAWDDGTQTANTGGSPSRTRVFFAEIDGCENGIRVNRQTISAFLGLRFIHRYRFSPNTTNLYWPRTCIDLNGGSLAGSVTQLDFQVIHRIESAMGAVLGLTVGANPVSTSSGTNVITINTTDPHTFTTGWTVAVLNSAAVGGVPAAEINGEHVITVTGTNSFAFTSTTVATSTVTGGGTTITLSPLDALGQMVDAHNNANIFGVNIEQQEINNAGFTSITADPSRLFGNVSVNSSFLITRLGRPLSDTRIRNGFQVRGAIGRTILSQTLSQTTSKQIYATELVDRLNWHDTTTGLATIGVTGTYDVFVSDTFVPNATSAQVEIAVAKFVSGAFNTLLAYKKISFATGLGETTFELSRTVQLTKGDQVAYIITQTTAAGGVSGTSTTSGSTTGMMFSCWQRGAS